MGLRVCLFIGVNAMGLFGMKIAFILRILKFLTLRAKNISVKLLKIYGAK